MVKVPEKDSRDSIGSFIQLYGVGAQDVHLTYIPEITFFQRGYKQYLGFGITHETVEIPIPSEIWGTRSIVTLSKDGTYLSNMILSLKVSEPSFANEIFQSVNSYGVLELIDSISLRVGTTIFDTVSSDHIMVHFSKLPSEKFRNVCQMVRGNLVGDRICSMIPLPFWFCHWNPSFDNGGKFPLHPMDLRVPISVEIQWKIKENCKCICSSKLSVQGELFVDYVVGSKKEVDYLRSQTPKESQPELVSLHAQEVERVTLQESKIPIRFKGLARQIAWGFKPDVDLVDYIQADSSSEQALRSSLSSEARTVADVQAVVETRRKGLEVQYERNMLSNVQVPGYLLRHYTFDRTLYDYLSNTRLNDDPQVFFDRVLHSSNSLFEDLSGNGSSTFHKAESLFQFGVSSDSKYYSARIRKGREDLFVSCAFFPTGTWQYSSKNYRIPLISLVGNTQWGATLATDRNGWIYLQVQGAEQKTALQMDLNSFSWTTLEVGLMDGRVQVRVIGTEVSEIAPFLWTGVYAPSDLYTVIVGNHPSVAKIRDRASASVALQGVTDYPSLSYPSSYLSETGLDAPRTKFGDYEISKQGTSYTVFFQGQQVKTFTTPSKVVACPEPAYGFSAPLVRSFRLFLGYSTTLFVIDGVGPDLFTSTLSGPIQSLYYDPQTMKLWCYCGGTTMTCVDTVDSTVQVVSGRVQAGAVEGIVLDPSRTLVYDSSSVWINTSWYGTLPETPTVFQADTDASGNTYLITGTKLVRIGITGNTVSNVTVNGLKEVHVYDQKVYLLVMALNDTVEIHRRNLDLTVDTTFGNSGVQKIYSGYFRSGAAVLERIDSKAPPDSSGVTRYQNGRVFVQTSTAVQSSNFSRGDLQTKNFPQKILAFSTRLDTEAVSSTVACNESTVFWGTSSFGFVVYPNVSIRCDASGVRVNDTLVSYSSLAVTMGSLVLAHPLFNEYFAVMYDDNVGDRKVFTAKATVSGVDSSSVQVLPVDPLKNVSPSAIDYTLILNDFTYSVNGVATVTLNNYMQLPMYDVDAFIQTAHLNLYNATSYPMVLGNSPGTPVVLTGTSFRVRGNTVQTSVSLFGSHTYRDIQVLDANTFVYLFTTGSDVKVAWVKLNGLVLEVQSLWVLEAASASSEFPCFIGNKESNVLHVYSSGFDYPIAMTVGANGTLVSKSTFFDYPYVFYRSMNYGLVSTAGLDLRIVDLDGQYNMYSTGNTHSHNSNNKYHLYHTGRDVFWTVGPLMQTLTERRPEPTQYIQGIPPMLHVDQDFHVIVDCSAVGTVRKMQLPLLRTTVTSYEQELVKEFARPVEYRNIRSYSIRDLRISSFPQRPLPVAYTSLSKKWKLQVYDQSLVELSSSTLLNLIGSLGQLVFYDILGRPLTSLVSSTSLTGNSIEVVFTKPVQLESIMSFYIIGPGGSPIPLVAYMYHWNESLQQWWYYYAYLGNLVQLVPNVEYGFLERRFYMNGMTSVNTSVRIPRVEITTSLSSKLEPFNSFAYTPFKDVYYRIELGEAKVPFQLRSSSYYDTIIPFYTLQNSPEEVCVNRYSFALFPTYFQPSGHYDLNQTSNYLVYQFLTKPPAGQMFLFADTMNFVEFGTGVRLVYN